jgi:hypothetical protein
MLAVSGIIDGFHPNLDCTSILPSGHFQISLDCQKNITCPLPYQGPLAGQHYSLQHNCVLPASEMFKQAKLARCKRGHVAAINVTSSLPTSAPGPMQISNRVTLARSRSCKLLLPMHGPTWKRRMLTDLALTAYLLPYRWSGRIRKTGPILYFHPMISGKMMSCAAWLCSFGDVSEEVDQHSTSPC